MGDAEVPLSRRTARAGTAALAGQIARLLIQVVGVMVLARILRPEAFGLVAIVAAWIGVVGLFREMGLATATIQARDITAEQLSTLYWVSVSLGLVTGGIVALAAPWLAEFYKEPALMGIALGLALTHVVGGMCLQHRALLRRELRLAREVAIDTVSALAGMVGAIVVACLGGGYWALVALPVITSCVAAILLHTLAPYRPSWPALAPGVEELVSFGASLTGAGFLAYVARNADRAMLGWRWGANPVGHYTKALQVLGLTTGQVTAGLWDAVVPALSRLQDDPERFARTLRRVMNAVLWPVALLAGVFAAVPNAVVHVVLGSQWADAGPLLRIAAIMAPAQAVCAVCGWSLASLGQGGRAFRLFAMTTPLVVLVLWLALPWGATGVLAALVVSQLLVVAPLTVIAATTDSALSSRHVLGASLHPLLGGLLASLGAFAVQWALGGTSAYLLLPAAVLGGFLVAAAYVALSGRARAEILRVVDLVRRSRSRNAV